MNSQARLGGGEHGEQCSEARGEVLGGGEWGRASLSR